MRLQGSDNSHARKQHRSAIFGGIDEHLNSKPPFLTITFWLGKLPDVVGGVSQGLRRRSLREGNRLSEWTIPGHAELPSQTSKRPRRGPLESCSGGTGNTGSRRGVSMLVPLPQAVLFEGRLFTAGPVPRTPRDDRLNARVGPGCRLISFETQRRRNLLAARSRGTREPCENCRSSIRNSAATD